MTSPLPNAPTVSEDDIAAFLINTPDFFERNADLLAAIQLTSPHGNRAVSLQERQMELLRDKIKGLELRAAAMIRAGSDNEAIANRLQTWTLRLLAERDAAAIPQAVVTGLEQQFGVPQVALRLWQVDATYADDPCAAPVSDNVKTFAASLTTPYCGHNPDLEAVHWLSDASAVRSVALIPLRRDGDVGAFGLLVLGSPEPERFAPDMGVDFLQRIGAIVSAALARVQAA